MQRRIPALALTLLVAAASLVACASPATPAIFDRERTTADELPAGVDATVDSKTSRYVGEDSANNQYWVVRDDLNGTCIIVVDEETAAPWSGCGGVPIALTIGNELRVELADYPDQLSQSNAELIGDTLLVGIP